MKFGWRGALGILLSAAFLYFAFRGIAFAEVATHIRRADLGLLLLSAVAATCIFPLRALRWRPILDPIAPRLSFSRLWSATAIGMMINNVVPARAGEFARAYALSRSTPDMPFPAAFASLAVDRLFDAVVVLLLMLGAMLDPAFPRGATLMDRPVASYAAVFLLVTLVGVGVLSGAAPVPTDAAAKGEPAAAGADTSRPPTALRGLRLAKSEAEPPDEPTPPGGGRPSLKRVK